MDIASLLPALAMTVFLGSMGFLAASTIRESSLRNQSAIKAR